MYITRYDVKQILKADLEEYVKLQNNKSAQEIVKAADYLKSKHALDIETHVANLQKNMDTINNAESQLTILEPLIAEYYDVMIFLHNEFGTIFDALEGVSANQVPDILYNVRCELLRRSRTSYKTIPKNEATFKKSETDLKNEEALRKLMFLLGL